MRWLNQNLRLWRNVLWPRYARPATTLWRSGGCRVRPTRAEALTKARRGARRHV